MREEAVDAMDAVPEPPLNPWRRLSFGHTVLSHPYFLIFLLFVFFFF